HKVCDTEYAMDTETRQALLRTSNKLEALLSAFDKYVRLSLSIPFIFAGILILLYYVGGEDLRRMLDFITFSPSR
ncbi:MAG TPA: hypothetical protein VGV35_17425, partial [Bryobacteraceae bacterium]|nr:hypothetical protein [Bryobacteraceae bacterium]